MKTMMWVLLSCLALPAFAQAEEFTMTRGYDGKTFYCTDNQGGSVLPAPSVTVCDCMYSTINYGQVLAASTNLSALRPACQAFYAQATIQNCKSVTAPQGTVSCDCIYATINYGQVLAGIGQLDDLLKSCHQSYIQATLKNCKVQ